MNNDETENRQELEERNDDGGATGSDEYLFTSFSSLESPSSSSSSSLFRNVRLCSRQSSLGQQVFDLQTSVTTFERNVVTVSDDGSGGLLSLIMAQQAPPSLDDHCCQRVDVHAQVHFGCQAYFDYFNTPSFQNQYDAIHYELLVDDSLLSTDNNNTGIRYIPRNHNSQLIMASPYDQQTARQYGLCCQVDVIDYTQPNWIHSDLTRQELLAAISTSSENNQKNNNNKPTYFSSWWNQQQESQQQQQPLWALASSAPTWPGVEAAVALLRPLTPSLSLSMPVVRRLFSNLFLPGTTLTAWLRAMLWLTLPCPELSVLLLDWSSLWPPPSGTLSPIALPVVECLLTGNIRSARQLILAQMLVSQQQQQLQQQPTNRNNPEPLLIGRRNDHAWNTITTTSLRTGGHVTSVAVLYGVSHIPDLTRRLIQDGFVPVQTHWRTAWSVMVPSSLATDDIEQQAPGSKFAALSSGSLSTSRTALAVGLVLLPLYFAIGGWDWISTLQDVAKELEMTHVADAGIEVVLYLIRHALLYLGLAKFVVEWDTNKSQ